MGACGPTDVVIQAGAGVVVTGSGTPSNPFVITSELGLAPVFTASDSSSVQLSIFGSGTDADPYVLSADASGGLNLAGLADVDSPSSPAAGQVPTWVGGSNGHFEFQTNGTWWVTAATRPDATIRYTGLRIHERDTGKDFEWDGNSWVDKSAASVTSVPVGNLEGRIGDDNLPRRLNTDGFSLTSEDLNTVRFSGFFRGTNVTNAPDTGTWLYEIIGDNANAAVQVASKVSDGTLKRRFFNGTAWSAWAVIDPQVASIVAEAAGHVTTGTMTAASGRFTQTIHVTFPTGRFAAAPESVTFGVRDASAVRSDVRANNVTQTGFDLVFWRDAALSGVRIDWIARAGG